jgi:UDP:flavonoid glycosyltransferase YjiC (YdhE family)
MTLLGGSWALSGRVLIPDFPEPNTLSLDTIRIPDQFRGKVEFIGAILQRKPGSIDKEEVRKKLGVEEGEKLVFAGISGPAPERLPLLQVLEPLFREFPEEYRVVMSMGTPSGGSEPENLGRLIKVPWLEDRFSVLEACDAVVSRGGHETLMQSICYGKPSAVIPVPNHPEQYGNARRAESIGVAKLVHQKDLSRETLLAAIQELENPGYASKLKELEGLHLGDGIDRCIDAIVTAKDWSAGYLSKDSKGLFR